MMWEHWWNRTKVYQLENMRCILLDHYDNHSGSVGVAYHALLSLPMDEDLSTEYGISMIATLHDGSVWITVSSGCIRATFFILQCAQCRWYYMVASLLSFSTIKLRFWSTLKACSDMWHNMLGLGFSDRKCDLLVCINVFDEWSIPASYCNDWLDDGCAMRLCYWKNVVSLLRRVGGRTWGRREAETDFISTNICFGLKHMRRYSA